MSMQTSAHKPNLLESMLARQAALILDGGLATELERRGADLNHALWSAKMLVDNPQIIRDVHLDYLRAGADIITSASYQGSRAGFEAVGLDHAQADDLLRTSVRLAVEARDIYMQEEGAQFRLAPLVAASVGPYGATLADGSEYHGNYAIGDDALVEFHRERLAVLASAGADLLAIETIPSLQEAQAVVSALDHFPGTPAWLSFSCGDALQVCHGEPFAHCAQVVSTHPQVVAVGVNCSNPDHIEPLLRSVGPLGTPLVVYPNSGERWDAANHCWRGRGRSLEQAEAWFAAGARLIGGCCRVGPDAISALRATLLK